MSGDCCVAIPQGATGLSAVCDCGNFLIILTIYFVSILVVLEQDTFSAA